MFVYLLENGNVYPFSSNFSRTRDTCLSRQSMKITTFFRFKENFTHTLIDLLTAVCLISFNFVSVVQSKREEFIYWICFKDSTNMVSTFKPRGN